MKSILIFFITLYFISCKPEKAYFPIVGKYVGEYKCNNYSFLVFSFIFNNPQISGFNSNDTLTINGLKNENVFMFNLNDTYIKDSGFIKFENNTTYLITGRNEKYRKNISCINRKLYFFDNIIKVAN